MNLYLDVLMDVPFIEYVNLSEMNIWKSKCRMQHTVCSIRYGTEANSQLVIQIPKNKMKKTKMNL